MPGWSSLVRRWTYDPVDTCTCVTRVQTSTWAENPVPGAYILDRIENQ